MKKIKEPAPKNHTDPPIPQPELKPEECRAELSPSFKQRLDQLLAYHPAVASRAVAQRLIADQKVWVNQSLQKFKPSVAVNPPDEVWFVPPPVEVLKLTPVPRPLELHFEDADLLVVYKPAGVCVHPSYGHFEESLVHYLLSYTQLATTPEPLRPGIVHRLDKNTSGLLMVAKTTVAYQSLVQQLQQRTVQRLYLCIVCGRLPADSGIIQQPIGRDPNNRKKMAITANGRTAETRWWRVAQFAEHALLACQLKTGRTHQIRVHLKHLGHPVYQDAVYGYKKQKALGAHALHACNLGFVHPVSKEYYQFLRKPPLYFQQWVQILGGDWDNCWELLATYIKTPLKHVKQQ